MRKIIFTMLTVIMLALGACTLTASAAEQAAEPTTTVSQSYESATQTVQNANIEKTQQQEITSQIWLGAAIGFGIIILFVVTMVLFQVWWYGSWILEDF